MRHRVAQGDQLEKRSNDVFLVGIECPQARRVRVGRPERSHQRLSDHGGIVEVPEGVVDQSREIVTPGAGVQITNRPEGKCFEVCVGRLVLNGIEWDRQLVAIDSVGSAQRERRGGERVGAEDFERAGNKGCRAQCDRNGILSWLVCASFGV